MKNLAGSCALFLLISLGLPGARAIGLIVVDEPAEQSISVPNLSRLRPIHRFTPLEIKSVKVTGKIKDQVAQTRIEEEFYNPGSARLEGTFYLPLPKGAHLEKLALEVNGKMQDAELLTADKAKSIYEEIVRKAKDPALLEYLGRDLVKLRIFPIEPHSTKRIEVSYTQLLDSDSGLVSYVLPLNSAKYCAAPVKNLSLKLELENRAPIKTIYSPTHSPEIVRKSDKNAVIGFEIAESRPERDFQLLYSAAASEVGLSLLTHRKPGEDGYFMLLATPGVSGEKVVPKDVVFVMDTSGSMAGAKIQQARKALQFCIANLNASDRFEVIRFSTESEALFKRLADVSDETRKQGTEFAENLKTLGGTAINDALEAALKVRPADSERPFFVVFVTDGLPTVGVTSEDLILENVKKCTAGLTRVFCFGLGTDVNTHLLDQIAEGTRAVSQYVLPEEDLEVKLSSFFSKISDPLLTDVGVDFGSIRSSKLEPGKLPDLFKGQQIVAFGRYSAHGKTRATIAGKVRGQKKEFGYDVEFPESSSSYEFIPRLWATRRVGHLLDEIRLHGESSELKEEVTTLAKQYGIVTPYTSFLVTEDAPVTLSSAPASSDPLGFYRRNPELMHRYFPHKASGMAAAEPAQAAKSGDLAVADSRYGLRLRETLSESEALQAPRELKRYAATGRLTPALKDERADTSAERFVGRRTFRFDGTFWVETSVLQLGTAVPVRLEFDSKEYWAFAAAHPELSDVLALGTHLKFLHESNVYEVFAKK